MADKKNNPLIGAFRTPVPETPPDKPGGPLKVTPDPKAIGTTPAKVEDGKKPVEPPKAVPDPKATGTTPAKVEDDKKPAEPPKAAPDPKTTSATPAKAENGKKPTEPPKAVPDPKATDTTPTKAEDGKKPTEPPKAVSDPKVAGTAPAKAEDGKKPTEPSKAAPDPKATDTTPTKAEDGKKPTEPPKAAPDHKTTGTTPAKAEDDKKPAEPPKAVPDPKAAGTTPAKAEDGKKPAESPEQQVEEEIPEDFKLPLTKMGQSEIITTLKVDEIHPFEGHPFHVKDDKDMMDLVDSVKKFGVLEPVVVIPREEGGYEMVSGHRRRRACELAGIATMPVIVRQLDRDEAVISMVDANLKRENISPMEKARAYAMKLEAMRHKAGRRSKQEIAEMEAQGKKPMRADEELAQQTGESRSNIQKLVRLNNLTPELQEMVEDKTLPVHTAADLSYLKKDEQAAVADAIEKEGGKVPSGTQAAELKKASQAGTLTTEKIEKSVAPTKRETEPPLKVTLNEEDLRPYFPNKGTTIPDVKKGIFEALDLRKKAIERKKAQEAAKSGTTKKSPEPVR